MLRKNLIINGTSLTFKLILIFNRNLIQSAHPLDALNTSMMVENLDMMSTTLFQTLDKIQILTIPKPHYPSLNSSLTTSGSLALLRPRKNGTILLRMSYIISHLSMI